jgi:hypothetical protein
MNGPACWEASNTGSRKYNEFNGVDYDLFPVRQYFVHNVLDLYLGDIYPKKKDPKKRVCSGN